MHTRNFYGVDIEEDLGIPLSYDAAWKIFNRWPREVRVQHQRLGQRTTPSKHAWCFCEEKNCTTRCPFFGFYRKKDGQAENKLSGIMTHAVGAAERGETECKDLLRSLNKWYNSRCAAGSSQVLDLSKLEQLKIKYKYPVLALNKKNSSRRFRRRDSRSFIYNDSKYKQPSVTSSKTKKHSRAIEECDNSELYYTIEKQLRNLSVSQSRLKHMSASLCRLAYAKKQASRMKMAPKIYKRKVVRRYRSDIPIVSNCESTGNTNTSSKTSNFCSKSSRNSKTTKSTEFSKDGETTESSKFSKARKISKRSKSSKCKRSSKNSKLSKGKLSESSKTTESTKASKSSKVSKDSKVSSKVIARSKTSKSSKTSKTSESSKTSDSYKSINGSKVTSTSKSSDNRRGKGTRKSGYTSKTGATCKSGGAVSLSTDASKRSRTSKSKATDKNSASSKATNVTTATSISHPVVRSIHLKLAKGKRGATRSAGDEEVKCKRKATTGRVMKEHVKVEKPQIHRIGGANDLFNRSNRRPIVAWNSGASGGAAYRKPTVATVTRSHSKFAGNNLAPISCLIRKNYKRSIVFDAGGGGEAESHHGGRRKITRKPSVRISKPILSFFRKQRTISKQSMTMRGKKSRCFFNKGERRK